MVGAAGALLIVTVTAAAYFATGSSGGGSGSNKLGGGEGAFLTYKISFPEGLKPGQEEPIEITTVNTASHATSIASWHIGLSIDKEHAEKGCEASWFEISSKSQPEKKEWSEMLEKVRTLPIEPGEEVAISRSKEGWGKWGVDYYLKFKEEPVNQSACEYATVTVWAES